MRKQDLLYLFTGLFTILSLQSCNREKPSKTSRQKSYEEKFIDSLTHVVKSAYPSPFLEKEKKEIILTEEDSEFGVDPHGLKWRRDTVFSFWFYYDVETGHTLWVKDYDASIHQDDFTEFYFYYGTNKFTRDSLNGDIISNEYGEHFSIFLLPTEMTELVFNAEKGYSETSLKNAIFDSSLTFFENKYMSDFEFRECRFKQNAMLFSQDTFKNNITFRKCYSEKQIIFYDQDGPGIIDIDPCVFSKDLIFTDDSIKGKIDLTKVEFINGGKLVYQESTLPDTLIMQSMNLTGIVDFTRAYPPLSGEKCEVNLSGIDVSKILMQYKYFHLYIPDSIRNNQASRDFVSSNYESLLNNFKVHGFTDSYEELDIEYKDWQSNWDWSLKLSDAWWEYGYRKGRILLYSMFFIFLFSIINFAKFRQFQTVYPVAKLNFEKLEKNNNTAFFLRKYFMILLYTGLIFFRFSIDFKNINFNPLRYVALLIFQYTVGLVCTGFLINWILKG